MNKSIPYLFILLLLCGCGSAATVDNENQAPFFDMVGFMENEIKHLQVAQPPLRKRITMGKENEIQNFEEVDWEKELAVFLELGINKPAWRDKFVVLDTIKNRQRTLSYTSVDKNLPIQSLEVIYMIDSELMQQIRVIKEQNTFLMDTQKELSYYPERKMYIINSTQQSLFGSEKKFHIQGKWFQ